MWHGLKTEWKLSMKPFCDVKCTPSIFPWSYFPLQTCLLLFFLCDFQQLSEQLCSNPWGSLSLGEVSRWGKAKATEKVITSAKVRKRERFPPSSERILDFHSMWRNLFWLWWTLVYWIKCVFLPGFLLCNEKGACTQTSQCFTHNLPTPQLRFTDIQNTLLDFSFYIS